jgi:sodium/proline symporter
MYSASDTTSYFLVFVWKSVIAPMGRVLAIYELLPAFAAIILVSLVTGYPDNEVKIEYDSVKRELSK